MIVKVAFKSSWIYEPSGANSFSVSKLIKALRDELGQKMTVLDRSITGAVIEIEGSLGCSEGERLVQRLVESTVCAGQSWSNACVIEVSEDGSPGDSSGSDDGESSTASSDSAPSVDVLESPHRLLAVEVTAEASAIPDPAANAPAVELESGEPGEAPEAMTLGLSAEDVAGEGSSPHASSVIAEVESLVAVTDFKALCQEIARNASFIKSRGTSKVLLSTTLLFSVAAGGGLSRSLELINSLLVEKGIFAQEAAVKEVSLPNPSKSDIAERMNNLLGSLDHVVEKPGTLCIDISEWTNKTTDPTFKSFLLWLFRKEGSCLVVLRTPYLGDVRLKQVCLDISDILSVRAVTFTPFDPIDLRELAKRVLSDYGFCATEEAWRVFDKRMEIEKRDGCFYGIRTVQKVANELIRCVEGDTSIVEGGSSVITGETAAYLVAEEEADPIGGFDRFDGLIGMESIKTQMMEVVNQILVSKSNPSVSRPNMHMRFVGNPGTGKTTVARILGEVLRESGVLRIGRFYEHKARDLCGRYIGETAPKTTAICQQAYGSVLFLDEAYALYRGDDNDRDYGREAIDTLITEMENHSDDLIVIMAGYPDDMEKMMDGNAGLRSRMPYTIVFPNYTRGQLFEIFMKMIEKAFDYTPELEVRAKSYFESLDDALLRQKSFGNARFVRNLFERVWGKAAMRCRSRETEILIDAEDFDAALASMGSMYEVGETSQKIGFV